MKTMPAAAFPLTVEHVAVAVRGKDAAAGILG